MVQPATEINAISGGRFCFGRCSRGAAGEGPPEVGRNVMHRMRERSLPVRVLVYATTATLVFVLAAGVGAMGALILRGDVAGLLERGEPQPADEQDVGRAQQADDAAEDGAAEREVADVEQKEDASQLAEDAAEREEADYVGTVGDIQTRAVETFMESHDKLLRYDALTADDVDEMKANETALQDMTNQAANLAPPRKYEEQHEVFGAAIDELREAARMAHGMAADPVAAAELGFDEYEARVNEASALLRRSNELLGKDYEALEGVREISPEF